MRVGFVSIVAVISCPTPVPVALIPELSASSTISLGVSVVKSPLKDSSFRKRLRSGPFPSFIEFSLIPLNTTFVKIPQQYQFHHQQTVKYELDLDCN